jgi:hypothetical protein
MKKILLLLLLGIYNLCALAQSYGDATKTVNSTQNQNLTQDCEDGGTYTYQQCDYSGYCWDETVQNPPICGPIYLAPEDRVDNARDWVKLKEGFRMKATDNFTYKAKVEPSIVALNAGFSPASAATSTPFSLEQNRPVGFTAGSFAPTPSGAASYTIPIQVAPGTGGMQPNLSVAYNSQAKNGMMGWGFDLSGLSAIVRTGKDVYHDGNKNQTALNFTSNDRLVFDGQRLSTSNSNAFAPGNTYQTETESFSNITSYSLPNGAIWFEVKTKDGTVMEFGRTDDSRHEIADDYYRVDNRHTLAWKINKITDFNGNYMTFTYASGRHITQIDYTGNSNHNKPTYNRVHFLYDERFNFPQTFFYDGATGANYSNRVRDDALLKKIIIQTQGNFYKQYDFEYATDVFTKLFRITETDANGVALNPTVIQWAGSYDGNNGQTLSTYASTGYDDNSYSGDFNGDGITDLAIRNQAKTRITFYKGAISTSGALSFTQFTGGVYNTPTYTRFGGKGGGSQTLNYIISSIYVSDLNNDGKAEVYLNLNNGVTYKIYPDANAVSSSQLPNARGGYNFIPSKTLEGDFDGDKKTDYIMLDNVDYYTQGTGGSNIGTLGSFQLKLFTEDRAFPYVIGDMNGNGKSDITFCYNDISGHRVFELNAAGTAFEQLYYSNEIIYREDDAVGGDFNGDGKTDLLIHHKGNGHYAIAFSNGSRYTIPNKINLNDMGAIDDPRPFDPADQGDHNLRVGDFNGDGASDMAYFHKNNGVSKVRIYYFTGKIDGGTSYTFTEHDALGSIWEDDILVGDFNADGASDILHHTGNGYPVIDYGCGSKVTRVAKITNGFGNELVFNYKSLLSDANFFNPQISASRIIPNSLLNGCTNCRIDVSDPYSPTNPYNNLLGVSQKFFNYYLKLPMMALESSSEAGITTHYEYQGAIVNTASAKGFLGFETIAAYSAETDKRLTSHYVLHPKYLFMFKESDKLTNMAENKEFSLSLQSQTFVEKTGTNRFFSYPSGEKSLSYIDGKVSETISEYDVNTGNPTSATSKMGFGTIVNGNVAYNSNSMVATVVNKYEYTTINSLQRVTKETTKKSRSDVEKFDEHTTDYTYESDGRLKTTTVDKANPNYWKKTEIKARDAWGNPTQTETTVANAPADDPSRTQSVTYDATGRFVLTSTDPQGYVSSTEYHPVLGLPTVCLQEPMA